MQISKGVIIVTLFLSFGTFYITFVRLGLGKSRRIANYMYFGKEKNCFTGDWIVIKNSSVKPSVVALAKFNRFKCAFTEILFNNNRHSEVFLSSQTHFVFFDDFDNEFKMINNFYDVKCWNNMTEYHTTIVKFSLPPSSSRRSSIASNKGKSVLSNSWSMTFESTTTIENTEEEVEEDGCKYPYIDFFHKSVYASYRDLGKKDCPGLKLTLLKNGVLSFDKSELSKLKRNNITIFKCEIFEIVRRGENSNNYIFYKQFVDRMKIPFEFIRIECFDGQKKSFYRDHHAQIIPKPGLNISQTIRENPTIFGKDAKERLSVLIIGLDSTSRGNIVRHFPKLRSFLLNKMKAFELKRFNKVQKNTVVNLVPFLYGKYVNEIEQKFVKESNLFSKHFYDDIIKNFIWNDFQKLNYKTLFAEDAYYMATFNYLTRGFRNPPTDYYYR